MMPAQDLMLAWMLSALTPYVLEWLKQKPWFPLIQPYTPALNRATAVAASILTSLGVTWTFDREAGRLVVDGLILEDLARFGFQAGVSFVVQEVVYRTRINGRLPEQ